MAGIRKVPKEYMAVLRPYLDSGVLTLENGKHHAMVRHKDGHKRPVPCTPSDWNALKNFESQLRRFVEGTPASGERCKHNVRNKGNGNGNEQA